ncbi:MAG: LytR C-terminal domain-containing protein [Patescibacteria group bacterium]|nr:LytR C-terminal domain-containing protein [Patescibacteria group bacterium]
MKKPEEIKVEEIKKDDVLVTEEVVSENKDQEIEETKPEPEAELGSELGLETKSSSSTKKYFLIGLVVVIILGLIGGGVLVYKKAMMGKQEKQEDSIPVVPSPTPVPVEEQEASPAAELKREDIKIQILNGTGIAGEAKKAKDLLEDLGYTDIKIGNAGAYDYDEVEISLKEEKSDYFSLLSADLKEEYDVSNKMGELAEDDKFDAIVILGQ